MASEKELFVTKQYVPTGQPMVQNDHTIIYRVQCMAEPGHPDGVLKMYRKRNIKSLYDRLKQLDYSEWPHIYAVKYFDENTLIVEEYLKGSTLAELLEENRSRNITFTEAEAYNIMEHICQTLKNLNSIQPPIIHYNLKPSNIFITNTGAAKFLDFVPGHSKKKFSFQNILHTLGAIFHEMLTGQKPKNGKCTYEGRYQSILLKCLEKNPSKSYASIDELQQDMEYAKTHEMPQKAASTLSMPYTLTMPFQGFIILLEWTLFCFFYTKNQMSTAQLFILAFILHSIIYAVRRYSFFKKNPVVSPIRRAVPWGILIILLFGVFYAISTFLS